MSCACGETVVMPQGCKKCKDNCRNGYTPTGCIVWSAGDENCLGIKDGDTGNEFLPVIAKAIPKIQSSTLSVNESVSNNGCRVITIDSPLNPICFADSDTITVGQTPSGCWQFTSALPAPPTDNLDCLVLRKCGNDLGWFPSNDFTPYDLTKSGTGSGALNITGGSGAVANPANIQVFQNAINQQGVVPGTTISDAKKVYQADSSGNPGWGVIVDSGTYTPIASILYGDISSVNINTAGIYTRIGNIINVVQHLVVIFNPATPASAYGFSLTLPISQIINTIGSITGHVIGLMSTVSVGYPTIGIVDSNNTTPNQAIIEFTRGSDVPNPPLNQEILKIMFTYTIN
jgi:hypothetical protein